MDAKSTKTGIPATAKSEFVSTEFLLIGFLERIQPYFLHATICVLLIILIVVGLVYVDHRTKTKIASAYNELHDVAGKDLDAITDATELRKEASARKDKLKSLSDRFPNSPVAINAELQIAQLEFRVGNLSSAAGMFKKFQERYPQENSLVPLAITGEADCLFENHDFAAARDKYKNARERLADRESDSYLTGHVRFQAAVCSWLLGDGAGAKKMLDELLASKTNESIEQRAQSLMASMDIFPPEDFKAAIVAAKESMPEPTAPPLPEPVVAPTVEIPQPVTK